ncbi:DUF4382 domain-containing protein [Ferrimonas sediminum]|nr:DUF4382 domain-containing protein [Ferrimonas sediminum]
MKKRIVLLMPLLFGCGSDGGEPTLPTEEPVLQGLSIGVSDAPIDDVTAVVLKFDRIILTPAGAMGGGYHGNGPLVLELANHHVDMLQFQEDASHWLLNDEQLPVGRYDVRIEVLAGSGDQGSYVDDAQGRHPLYMVQNHINVGEIDIQEDGEHSYTLELDLRQSLHYDPETGYSLLYSGLRWVDNRTMGHLMGSIDSTWVEGCEADNAALADEAGQFSHVAYLYPSGTTLEAMDDMAAEPESGRVAPIATSYVHQVMDGTWRFGMGFLPQGEYQVGYSCLGHLDLPESNETGAESFAIYGDGGTVVIDAGSGGGYRNGHHCGGRGPGGGPWGPGNRG